jgi:hypothetical protein
MAETSIKRKEVILPISKAKVVLEKPKAGPRNKAMIEAEYDKGLKWTKFFVELMPYCIVESPWGSSSTPEQVEVIRKTIDALEIADYDELINALRDLVKDPAMEEAEKKSATLSEQASSPTTHT